MKIIVIGAGLAGAATAHALAVHGCEVTVLESSAPWDERSAMPLLGLDQGLGFKAPSAQTAPSAGLPVGLMAPHMPQQTLQGQPANHQALLPLTQLSHLGIAATRQAAHCLLTEGEDWQPCGALQRAGKLGLKAHWQSNAAWVKPAALVAAWLAHPRITLRTSMPVHSLRHTPDTATQSQKKPRGVTADDSSNLKNNNWQVLMADGSVAGEAHAVVLANAYQAKDLLMQLDLKQHSPKQPESSTQPNGLSTANFKALAAAMQPVAGQVIYGPWTADWQALWPTLLPELAQLNPTHSAIQSAPNTPQTTHAAAACAINGNGHFIPAVPWQGGHRWVSGSTYEHGAPLHPQVTAQGVVANLQRLQQLIPAAAALLATQHQAGLVQGWAGTRCTTHDRLPVVGAVSVQRAPGLYICSAMGSRGLSFAALCGQHVAAQITAIQSPLPQHLHGIINASRFI